MRYLTLLCCCVALLACKEEAVQTTAGTDKQLSGPQRTAKPGAAVQLQHRIESTVELAQPVAVSLDISTSSVKADVTVRLEVDANLELLSERRDWQLSLAAGEKPVTLPVSVALQAGQAGNLRVFVTQASPAGERMRSFTVPIRLAGAPQDKTEKSARQQSPGIIEMPAEENTY